MIEHESKSLPKQVQTFRRGDLVRCVAADFSPAALPPHAYPGDNLRVDAVGPNPYQFTSRGGKAWDRRNFKLIERAPEDDTKPARDIGLEFLRAQLDGHWTTEGSAYYPGFQKALELLAKAYGKRIQKVSRVELVDADEADQGDAP